MGKKNILNFFLIHKSIWKVSGKKKNLIKSIILNFSLLFKNIHGTFERKKKILDLLLFWSTLLSGGENRIY